ncbi:MAG: alpha/beta fold hydrolase [Hyphomicrobiaceae bacterium]|nr:MAG: alpha/beta fold hydrolase [Hyphomicrobiaceae bacterium]
MASSPLVLIPGYLLDRDLWRDVIAALPGREIIVPDLSPHDTVAAMAAHLLTISPPRFAVAGLSMGGYVAMEIAARAPERVAALGLVNTKPAPDTPTTINRRTRLRALADEGRLSEAHALLEPLMLSERHRREDAPALARLRAMYARTDAGQFVRHQYALNTRPDHRGMLAGVRCPTLVLASRQDGLIPLDVTLDMVRRLPEARTVILEGAGHLSPLERPAETACIVADFVREL